MNFSKPAVLQNRFYADSGYDVKLRKLCLEKNIVYQSFFLKKLVIIERANILSKKMSFKEKSDLYYRLERLLSEKKMGKLFKVLFAANEKTKFNLGFK